MIKKLNAWVKELTLTQQLMALILLFVAIFMTFLFVYLNGNVNSFVRYQMYNMLQRTQTSIIYNYERNPTMGILSFANDVNIGHAIYTTDGRLITNNVFNVIDERVIAEMKMNAEVQTETTKNYVAYDDGAEVLYAITDVEDEFKLISCVSNTYQSEFKKTLLNSVINIIVIVVSVMFILLMIWVFYLIHSLSQLRVYINKLRKGEDAEIVLDRKDEIGDLAEALVAMSKELKRQEQVKEELIQNISHDLKTPIATIKSYAESIKDGIYPYDSLEKSVDVIIEHATRLENKVQNLLLLNRVGYLVTTVDTGYVDLAQVIDKTLLSLKVIRPELAITREVESAMFYGNEEPWRVVVENLLDNALRYAQSHVIIRLNQNELSVENDGPHLTNERIEKLFKPYEKGTGGQFGLGLSIVHRVVTAYECEVYAYNTHDGVIFKVIKKNPVKGKEEKKKDTKRRNKNKEAEEAKEA